MAGLARWLRDQFDSESVSFDRRYGTMTRWFDLTNYEPSLPSVVEAILDAFGDPCGVRFVDLGSGKGRVVCLAAQREFKEVIGIEIRPRLHRRATRNLAAFRTRATVKAPVQLRCLDVLDWSPPEGPLVLFAYHPFPSIVWKLVLKNVPLGTRLAYINPVHEEAVLRSGFELREVRAGPVEDRCWRLYEKVT